VDLAVVLMEATEQVELADLEQLIQAVEVAVEATVVEQVELAVQV
jgi:hypothetical protein